MHYHLLPRGSTPGTSTGIQGEWYSFGVSSFPAGEGVKFWKRLRWTTGTYSRDLFEAVQNVSPGTMVDV